jgi:pSer/pThr/pTyr-binding forkhead associated (FHA) protein
MLRLVVASGKHAGRTIPFKDGRLLVGRGAECGAVLGSPDVSRKHCVFAEEKGGLIVEDLHSRNGTYVNGERIGLRTELKEGDVVRIGVLNFVVSRDGPDKKELSDWVKDENNDSATAPQSSSTTLEDVMDSRIHPGTIDKPKQSSSKDAADAALRKFFGRG